MPEPFQREVDQVDRTIRLASAVAVAVFAGFVVTFLVYDGPSIARAVAYASAFALGFALLSLVFGRRFWRFLAAVLFLTI